MVVAYHERTCGRRGYAVLVATATPPDMQFPIMPLQWGQKIVTNSIRVGGGELTQLQPRSPVKMHTDIEPGVLV